MIPALKLKSINLLFALVMVTLFTTLQSSSCSKSDDVAAINNTSTAPITGNWRVSFYWDKKDETNNLSGYSFSFNAGGVVTAKNSTTVVNGTWSESSSKLNIDFGTDAVLSDISSNWQIVEKTSTTIKLKDDNPLQDDQLIFTKN